MTPKQQWQRDGYLVFRNVLDPTTLGGLQEACEHALAQWRTDSTPDNQPNQFCHGPAAWIMLHLNHPRYFRTRHELIGRLLNAIATPIAIDTITQIMEEPPIFMQANFYLDPPQVPTDRGGRWHRDCEFFAWGDKEKQKKMLAEEAEPPREWRRNW